MRKIEYTIREIKTIANIVYLDLVPGNPKKRMKFRPGQYGLLSFFNGNVLSQERPFSFASSPTNEGSLQFGFKIFGQFTADFAELKKGESVFVRGPYGSFIFDERKLKDAVFMAAGIGITPFISALDYATEKKLPNKITLIFSNKSIKETPFFNKIRNLEKINKNFASFFAFSNESGNLSNEYIKGRVNEEVLSNIVKGVINRKTFFICGPVSYTNSVTEILEKLMVDDKKIITEEFSLAPKSFFEKGSLAFPITASASAALSLVIVYSIYAQANLNVSANTNIAPVTATTNDQPIFTQQTPSQKNTVQTANAQPLTPVRTPQTISTTASTPVVKTTTIKKVSRTTKPANSTPTVPKPTPKPVYTPPPVYYTPRTTVS